MSNSRFAKGFSDTQKLTSGLIDLNQELKLQRMATKKNNKELAKLNEVAGDAFENKIKNLESEIKSLKSQTWVETEEPALKLTADDLIKKLDVL